MSAFPDRFDRASLPPLPTTPRGHEVARHFRLEFDPSPGPSPGASPNLSTGSSPSPSRNHTARPCRAMPIPSPGQVVLLTGASGSGKSSLLRAMSRRARREFAVISVRSVRLPARPMIDCFGDEPLASTLTRLGRVGLAEVWTWLRPPSQLSEGQRWRLRVALALRSAERSARPTLLVCDEFAAVLDRVSAVIVARVLRRAVDAYRGRVAALLATSHDDLDRALAPDLRIDCDFGEYRLSVPKGRASCNRK